MDTIKNITKVILYRILISKIKYLFIINYEIYLEVVVISNYPLKHHFQIKYLYFFISLFYPL